MTRFVASNQTELDSYLNYCVNQYGFRVRYYFEVAVGVDGLTLTGGTWSIEGESGENNYEWQVARKYTSTTTIGIEEKKRSKIAGGWRGWV